MENLTLDANDPRVIAAKEAERKLFARYGLLAKDHEVLLPGYNIRVRVSEIGSGEPLIIVPGNTGDVFPLTPLLAEFRDRRIIAINRPGGGLSEGMDHTKVEIRKFAVETLETVLRYFKLGQVAVIAHSMGAHWSLWLAMDRPQLVSRLVLLGNPGNVMKGGPPLIIRLIAKPAFSRFFFWLLLPKDKTKALQSLKSMGHSKKTIDRLPRELSDAYYYFRLLPHYQISLTSLMANVAPAIDSVQLATVHRPVLFLLGTADTFASIATGQGISAAMPNCEFNAVEGAGHLPWLESPGECGRLINHFLAER